VWGDVCWGGGMCVGVSVCSRPFQLKAVSVYGLNLWSLPGHFTYGLGNEAMPDRAGYSRVDHFPTLNAHILSCNCPPSTKHAFTHAHVQLIHKVPLSA